VRKGETLTSIAENYNTTVAALRRDNRNAGSQLQAGEVIVVKTGQ
jgi:LysM repeat protein